MAFFDGEDMAWVSTPCGYCWVPVVELIEKERGECLA